MEMAFELRLPVPYLNTHLFLFWEKCSDLGFKQIGDWKPYGVLLSCRARFGAFGVGLKLGPVRAEWVHDDNQAKGNMFSEIWERF